MAMALASLSINVFYISTTTEKIQNCSKKECIYDRYYLKEIIIEEAKICYSIVEFALKNSHELH
jgi:hypothetical protein